MAKAKSSHKNKPTQPPATVLTITLNADGKGSLVAKRGDLAVVNQFTYRDMKDIIAAIQQGAAYLVSVEKAPPPTDLTTVSATSSGSPSTTPHAASVQSSEDEADADTTPEATEDEPGDEQSTLDADENIDAAPLAGITANMPGAQLSLL
jgi:hypothetical protein